MTAHLDLYDAAWLAGGRRRASQTAVAALVENGRVRVTDPTADLQAVGAGATHPVEAAVLDALGTRGHRGIETVVFLVRKDPRLDAVEERLVRSGLVARRGRLAAALLSPRTRAGRQVLRALRRDPGRRPGSAATAEVALHGLVRVPAGLPAGLADRPPSHWSFTRREPVDSDVGRIYATTWNPTN